jgi:multidrug efflux pump
MPFFEVCIHRPVMTAMMSLALLVFGVLGLSRLSVRELPDIDPSIVSVLTVYPGASAEVVETVVTEPLEDAISSAEAIKLLTSESREEVSQITIEFQLGRDIDLAAQDVRDRVARARGQLPDDIDEPIISKQDANAQPIMWLTLHSDHHSVVEMSRIADDLIKERLQTIPGVSSVHLGGEKKFAMRVRLDTERMAARGVTVLDVERALREQNVELPSGRVENLERELTIQTRGQLKTTEEFNRLIIRQEGTRVVRLIDVGYADEGVEDERSIARFNGMPTVGVGVIRQSRSNMLQIADEVYAAVEKLRPLMPEGLEIVSEFDESVFVRKAIHEVYQTLGIAFVLVVLTIFLFLRNFRSTLLPALSIPISIGATFGFLYLLGFSVNIFTLLALVLAIGIVVDDAIVVLENIYRHVENGMKPFDAAILTMKEIAFPVITITLSLVAVFLPLAFIGGITGRLLLEFAMALVAAVIVSAFVALTLSPMVGARVLRPISEIEHGAVFNLFERFFRGLSAFYEWSLGWCLDHRKWIVLVAVAALGLSGYFFSNLDREFLPEEDKGWLLGVLRSPEGATPEYTDRMLRQFEQILDETPEVDRYFGAVALPFAGPGDPTFGIVFPTLTEGKRRHVHDIVNGPSGLGARLFNEVEGAFALVIIPKAVDIGFSQPFELVVSHPDLPALHDFSDQLIARLATEGMLTNLRSSFELTKPELRVVVDRDRAGALGVSIEEVSRTLQILFGGQDLSEIRLGGKEYEVMVQLERSSRLTPSDLERIFVRSETGRLVQLSNVVKTSTGAGPNKIERFQRLRSTTIEGTPAGVTLGTAMARTEAVLGTMLPEGYSFDWRGEIRDLRESSADIYFFMLLAVVVVYMVLAAQFESLVHPFTVMLALPLAFVGAFGALYGLSWVNHYGETLYGWVHYAPSHPPIAETLSRLVPRLPSMNLNIFSQVGLIILIGLVTKNSILLVEFANQRMREGACARTAMLRAGVIRLRPILMTSMATIAGILPIAIGFGEAAESRRPLGVVAVGGLVTSTILTLAVIPVFYTLFADLAAWWHRGAGVPVAREST